MSIMFLVFPSLDRHVHFLQSFCWNFVLQIIMSSIKILIKKQYKSNKHQVHNDFIMTGLQDLSNHLQMSAPACPSVPQSLLTPVTAIAIHRHLWSDNTGDLATSKTRTVGFGLRSFSDAGPSVWNSLPSKLKTMSLTIGHFISQLKTVMFARSYYASAQPS